MFGLKSSSGSGLDGAGVAGGELRSEVEELRRESEVLRGEEEGVAEELEGERERVRNLQAVLQDFQAGKYLTLLVYNAQCDSCFIFDQQRITNCGKLSKTMNLSSYRSLNH